MNKRSEYQENWSNKGANYLKNNKGFVYHIFQRSGNKFWNLENYSLFLYL